MHPSALNNGKLFFDTYAPCFLDSNESVRVVEIGSQDVNGSIRQFCPEKFEYIGVDFVDGKGVDVIITSPYELPFDDNSVDMVVSSSCFEHSEMFWLVYLEIIRILKPHGLFYLNVPSNGMFHRYPVDCWRFYPDSGQALVTWSQRNGFDAGLLESYTSNQIGGGLENWWNDFVAVYVKNKDYISKYPKRILYTDIKYTNGVLDNLPIGELLNLQDLNEDHRDRMMHIEQSEVDTQTILQLRIQFEHLISETAQKNKVSERQISERDSVIAGKDHVISEKDHIISEKDHIISEKDHVILNREQQLLSQTHKYNKYKKLWVNRLVKPLIKTEQALSSANTLRKGFRNLVKDKGSVGKAYQHLRRLRKTKGVREVKLLLRNQKKVTAHKHLSIREMFSIKHDESQNILSKKPIDIIIPVYNGYDFLRPLFESIIQNTTQRYRLLVVDDCSSDKRVFDLLKEIKTQTRNVDFVLLRNEQNMGFIASVNKLVAHTKNHFVILNTDTEVPLGWLERLMYPILRMDKVASTTPFTNSGTICSFPRYLDDNSLFLAKSVEFIDGFFRKVNFDSTFIEIPTGVGFCMGVNKQLVKQIGMFDPVYGKGYGEENDWCQKAISKGYRNIHVTNLFVYHKHGGSFATDEKLRLLKNNLDILNKRYPNYSKEVSKVITENCLRDLRSVLAMEIISNCSDLTVLIEHSLGGGAGSYVNDLLKEKLKNDSSVLRIKFDFHASKKYMIELNYGVNVFQYVADSLDELNVFLDRLRIQEILINSVVSYPEIERTLLMLIELRNKNEAHLVYPLHDFFPLCPSWTLVNENDEYCDIPTDYSVCARCLKNNTNDFKQLVSSTDITQWRKTWGNLLHHCDEIRCFSQSSIDIFEKCYPEHHVRLTLIPHNISGRFENIYELLSDEIKQSNIIGVLGAINRPKGFNMIKQMVKFIEENNLDAKIIVIGKLSGKINSKVIHVTGTYDIDDLPSLIVRMKIAKFFIPSVCPETYSYTTDEVMQLGYPLYVFNIGAPAERVLNYPLGRVIQFNEWKSIVQNNRTESV